MEVLFVFIGIIFFFVVTLFMWNSYQRSKGNSEREETIDTDPMDGTCCGQHQTCEQDSLINAFIEEEIDYFDDEELDSYKGKNSDEYSSTEADQFREIFYTMNDEDKPRWIRSLQQREIEIPNQIKDEIIMIVNDLRSA